MTDENLLEIIKLWCIDFRIIYDKECNSWFGVIVHRSTMPPNYCLYEQETTFTTEYSDMLRDTIKLLSSRATAAITIIESKKGKYG